MKTLEDAIDLAKRAHAGQTDKAGQDYFLHCERVASRVHDEKEKMVAYLHDVLEDCDDSFVHELFEFPVDVLKAVILLTRNVDISQELYYTSIKENDLALAVKKADIADNTDETRLSILDESTQKRLRKKYSKALRLLNE